RAEPVGAQQAAPLPTLTPEALRGTFRPGDYLAILAYLPPNPDIAARVQAVRAAWARALGGCATTLGFGPRYLHSTGQLHKGGPNTGLFLVVTTDVPTHVEARVVGEIAGAAVRPREEDGGAWTILPAPHGLDAERARAEVGVVERERRRGARAVGVDPRALRRAGGADRVGRGSWGHSGAVVASVRVEGERAARLQLLKAAIGAGENERLRVQLEAQGGRERGVHMQRRAELVLDQVGEHVARAVRRRREAVARVRHVLGLEPTREVPGREAERDGRA